MATQRIIFMEAIPTTLNAKSVSMNICFRLLSAFLFFTFLSVRGFAQTVDFGKSYINISKGLSGGTLETGDTLEVRASFVVRSGTYDSCAYYDAIPGGTSYIPGTIRVLTNEGKIYKQFTDAGGDDEGWIASGNVRINLGFNQGSNPARWFKRGRVANNHVPSFYSSTCIVIASFRVRITAPTPAIINMGGGSITYKSGASPLQTFTFPTNLVGIYQNFGMCSNSIGANALGTEFNGTFGSGKIRNRGTSSNVPPSYTYNIFTANSPQDYYYGVVNNTSTINGYSTSNAWPKPDYSTTTHRVFNVWDIIGDHTNAASPFLGNAAADTVANNGGYMLVINASYRIDSAFQQTISGLCPNTYYEISCWMRNICSRCGCDSSGRGASTAGYIPTAPNDSSGVYPNLTFEVDGIDYYTTGNLLYTGKWVKKGFTFLTGPNQTSFTLKFFNNAPGGGGNDWALDDISVATCSPDLTFTPSNNPTICEGYTAFLGATVTSYFDNYNFYKWQKSTDNGGTWQETGYNGKGSPVQENGMWTYYMDYPSFIVSKADSGLKFRVLVASTASNLQSGSCLYDGIASVITLNIIKCAAVLKTDIISFSAKKGEQGTLLQWSVVNEVAATKYIVQRSRNGIVFEDIETLFSNNSERYTFVDKTTVGDVLYYRIKMVETSERQKLSKTASVQAKSPSLTIVKIINPFQDELIITLSLEKGGPVTLQLLDDAGRLVRTRKYTALEGVHKIVLPDTGNLPTGIYTIQVLTEGMMIAQPIMKK
ncbi:MAG: hypothetical protein ABIN57_09685 [Chitinophagaceae bacterium]